MDKLEAIDIIVQIYGVSAEDKLRTIQAILDEKWDPDNAVNFHRAFESLYLCIDEKVRELYDKKMEWRKQQGKIRVFLWKCLFLCFTLWRNALFTARKIKVFLHKGRCSRLFQLNRDFLSDPRIFGMWELEQDTPELEGWFCPKILSIPKEPASKKKFLERGSFAGYRHAEAMVKEQEKIPSEWRAYTFVFLGTTWVDEPGDEIMPKSTCVTRLIYCPSINQWSISFFWGDDFSKNFKAVVAENIK